MGSLKFEIFTWSKTCQPSALMLLREILCLFVISTTDNARMLNSWNKFIPFSYPLSNGPYIGIFGIGLELMSLLQASSSPPVQYLGYKYVADLLIPL